MIGDMIKQALVEGSQLKQIGRIPRFYDNSKGAMVEIPRHGLEMWPGYMVKPETYISGLYVNIDCATKFIQNESVLSQLSHMVMG
jgi:hypothetical protein